AGWPKRLRSLATAERTNSQQFGELSERWAGLNARFQCMCLSDSSNGKTVSASAAAACREVSAHRAYVADELGIRVNGRDANPRTSTKWVTGTGFIEMWHRLHQAESALIIVSSDEEVIRAG